MSLEYLPIMAHGAAPKPPRVLVSPSEQAWIPLTEPVNESKVGLLSRAALRLEDQQAFVPREDLSSGASLPIRPPAQLLSIIAPASGGSQSRIRKSFFLALLSTSLAQRGVIGGLSPYHFSFMGSVRHTQKVEDELVPAIAAELKKAAVDLALLVPY